MRRCIQRHQARHLGPNVGGQDRVLRRAALREVRVSVAAGVASAVVVLVLVGPPGRVPGRRSHVSGLTRRAVAPPTGVALEALLVAVGAQLRAGRAPRDAWETALGMRLVGDVPDVGTLVAACGGAGGSESRGRVSRARRGGAVARERLRLVERTAAVVAAAQTAHELGAPLVGVLERVTESLAADAAERDDVEAALAGPRATARVLGWLPLLGVALGTVLGADPVGVLLGGGLGTTAGVAGVLLLVAGRRWTAALLTRAARGAAAPTRARTGVPRRGAGRRAGERRPATEGHPVPEGRPAPERRPVLERRTVPGRAGG